MTTKHYPELESNPNFAAAEEGILAFWREHRIFEKSVENRPEKKADGTSNAYVFYDGPPFANGLPHYGHLLTGYVKDAIARYHTMKGSRVERRFGWDCHGLPAEMGAEKELGISGRAAITHYGIGKFNEYCRTSVMKYTQEWEYYVTRQGRWVDFANDYKTMDKNFMESCLWAFKELHTKGLIYESMRVMPYSWAAETPVSNFETRIDNATREREDKAAYVAFKVRDKICNNDSPTYLVAWTTTPWTLPSNLALAVKGDMPYVGFKASKLGFEANYICAETKVDQVMKFLGVEEPPEWTYAESGKKLLNLTYEPLFPYFADTPNAFRILDGSEFVTDGDGTGIVHMAPGFGEVDQKCCNENGIETLVPVDEKGRFTDAIYDLGPLARGEQATATLSQHPITTRALMQQSTVRATSSRSPLAGEPNPSSDLVGGNTARLTEYARDMRKEPTPWEAKLWSRLKGNQIGGFKFRRQEPIDHYIADFVNYEKRVIVELDGSQHMDSNDDKTRDAYLRAQNFIVVRFWNNELDTNIEGVLTHILEVLQHAPHRDIAQAPPHQIAQERFDSPAGGEWPPLSLRGLNVVADVRVEENDLAGMDPRKVDKYKEHVTKYGLANMRIIRWLEARGMLVKQEEIKHNYPHCWRTDTPLIYRAMSSWYVAINTKVAALGDRSVKEVMAANNLTIHWIPDHVQSGQMGRGIESAPDWSISRKRFWGTPIPIWKSESGKLHVCGSIEEIEKLSGQKVQDLHRPYIDNVVLKIDGEEYTRIEDVFDCWFESGSMPYAQVHYPFENKQQFEETFPADFITEYIAQTRGWFYTLQVLSAALFGKAPFKNVICHGVVIDEETGLKYSKRLKNYRDPKEVMDQYGADALRWMMLASPVMRGADLGVDPDGKFIRDVVRLNIKPLWSAYNFFTLYANADGIEAHYVASSRPSEARAGIPIHTAEPKTTSDLGSRARQEIPVLPSANRDDGLTNMLDRYILAKCKAAVTQVRASMDAYDTPGATEAITGFFEVLNNWYIRRSRPRFWGEEMTPDKQAAYDTLFTVLSLMCRASAPLLPFVSEAVYRGLHGDAASVHLTDFPDVGAIDAASKLVADMDWAQDVCNASLAIRNKLSIRTRQPLSSLRVIGKVRELGPLLTIICDEVNVEKFSLSGEEELNLYATRKLVINSAVLGKRLPEKMKQILPASKKGEWKRLEDGGVEIAGERLLDGEYSIQLDPRPEYKDSIMPLTFNDGIAVLDLTITPELAVKGQARDLVRMIQQARKDAGLHVADRITLAVDVPENFKAALATHGDYIAAQTLAVSIGEGSASAAQQVTQELDGEQFIIGLSKVA